MGTWRCASSGAFRALVVALAFASGACTRFAETTSPIDLRSVEVRFRTVTLANGLRVVLNEDHHVPLVAVAVTYGVGTSDSPRDRPDLAHTFEHLMFQGSAHVAGQGHRQYLERAGAPRIGGVTEVDTTRCFETVLANQLELVLWLESDRMGFLIEDIDQQKLDRVRPVIENEARQRGDNATIGHLSRLLAAAFPEGHPYNNPSLELANNPAITVEDAKRFGRTYYRPNNASLALSGDFDPATAVAMVDRYFGSLPPGPRPVRRPVPVVSLTEEVRIDVAASVPREEVLIAWPTPALGQPGDAELDIAARTLQSGVLQSALVNARSIALAVEARQHSLQRAGLFVIRIVLHPGRTAEAALKAVDEQLRIVRDLPADGILGVRGASEGMINHLLLGMQTLAGRADRLSQFDVLLRQPGYPWQAIDRYDSVQTRHVRNAIVRYLHQSKRVTLVVHADASAPAGGRLVRRP